MGTAAALIVGAIIAAAGGVASSVMMGKSQDRAMAESRGLANIQRSDVLADRAASEKLAREQLSLSAKQQKEQMAFAREGFAFQKEQAAQAQKEREQATSASQKKETYGNALALLNSNIALREKQSKYWR